MKIGRNGSLRSGWVASADKLAGLCLAIGCDAVSRAPGATSNLADHGGDAEGGST
jgi:hypothetical protein